MIVAQIATIPGREVTLNIARRSLEKQVDMVYIHENSPLDGLKFFGLNRYDPDDIILICDDDIEYPPDFVSVMLRYIEHNPDAVYTVMGKIMQPRPLKSFYRDELECFKTFAKVERLAKVEIPGTCGMAFKKSTCPLLDHGYFKSMNSDIWMGKYCKENGIPAYVIPHESFWLTNLMPMLPAGTFSVFDAYKNNDEEMTELVNSFL